jgi:hypothetical protein
MGSKNLVEMVKHLHSKSLNESTNIEEASVQIGSFGGRHNPKKKLHMTSLGNVPERSAAQRAGNQRRTKSTYAEEATQIAIKKVKNKKGEMTRGQTSTGQKADTLEFEPSKPELTTNH